MKRKSLIILLCLNIAFGVLGVMSEVFDFMGIMGDIMPIIDQLVDANPHAYYFNQTENGVYTRMAIISYLLGVKK